MEEKFANGKVSKVFIKFAILTNLLTSNAFFVDDILVGDWL